MKNTLLLLILFLSITSYSKKELIQSPNKKITVSVNINHFLTYSVKLNDKLILADSKINLVLENQILGEQIKSYKTRRNTVDLEIKPEVRRKFKTIRDHYNFLTITPAGAKYDIEFRVYNNGVAYKFITHFDREITVKSELAEFNFPKDFKVHFPKEDSIYSHQERRYLALNLTEIKKKEFCSTPALIDVEDGNKLLISESNLYDYPGMFLQKDDIRSFKAKFAHYPKKTEQTSDRDVVITQTEPYLAKTKGTRSFPWRLFVISETDADLVTSELVYQLADRSKVDASWVKPGKVAWDWWNDWNIKNVNFESGVNTETYKYYVDFAAKYGLEYVILDEGWYDLKDVMKVVPRLDMEKLSAYAKEKSVGLILWVTWKAFDDKLDQALNQFKKWGIKGVKVDFMQRDDQWMVNYYEKIAKKCAEYQMLVDFHGSYKPAGLRRAYPNVISYEGVHGNEQNKWASTNTSDHALMLPFTRMVVGPMDYTPGAMRNATAKNFKPVWGKPMGQGTRCHELAKYIVFESPLQMLCDNPSHYYAEPDAMKFLSIVPTVWDYTIVNSAEFGKQISLARKSGTKWFIGAMTNSDSRTINFRLNFLEKAKYKITIWKDGVNANKNAEDYKLIEKMVTNETELKIELKSSGGFVGVIEKL